MHKSASWVLHLACNHGSSGWWPSSKGNPWLFINPCIMPASLTHYLFIRDVQRLSSLPLLFSCIPGFLSVHYFCLAHHFINFTVTQSQLQAKLESLCSSYVVSPPTDSQHLYVVSWMTPLVGLSLIIPYFPLPFHKCYFVPSSQVLLFAKERFAISLRYPDLYWCFPQLHKYFKGLSGHNDQKYLWIL